MKKTLIASLAGVAAVTCLSACSPMPSTAAVADGVSISEKSIDQLVESCQQAGLPLIDERNTRADVVFFSALGNVAAAGGLGEGVVPSPEEARKVAQSQVPPKVLHDQRCGEFFVQNMQLSMGLEKLTQGASESEALDTLNGLVSKIELNPRYGRMKMQDNGQLTRDSGSLSKAIDRFGA